MTYPPPLFFIFSLQSYGIKLAKCNIPMMDFETTDDRVPWKYISIS